MTQKPTILIVDDEPYNVDLLHQELEDKGFKTKSAYGGREALDAVAEQAPDLILLDVLMPDIDGITVCRMLKDDPATRLIPIVIMTALGAKEDRIRGIEAGADDFLTKPVDDQELMARINTALRTKHVVDETIGELQSASEQLEGIGESEQEVAIVAVRLHSVTSGEADTSGEAADYLLARYRLALTEVLLSFDGELVESGGRQLVAVVRSHEEGTNWWKAFDAALAVRAESEALNRNNRTQPLDPAIAVHVGTASVGPRRVEAADGSHWILSVTGELNAQTLGIVSEARPGEILASSLAIERTRGRYTTEKLESPGKASREMGAWRILEASTASELDAEAMRTVVPEHRSPAERVLATILVTDLVGSTETAVRLGDHAWTELLDAHYQAVRGALKQFDGLEIDTAGDGFLALFEAPAKAIRAGLTIGERSGEMGLEVRVGVHTGEVERREDEIQGIAVHIAARVSAEASGGEVLVTASTKDSVAGSGLLFEDRGERVLKGLDEPRHLYAAKPD